MKPFVVLMSFLSAASAGFGGGGGTSFSGSSAGYAAGGSPPGYSSGFGGGGPTNGGYPGGGYSGAGGFGGGGGFGNGGYPGAEGGGGGGQVRKFVSVHVGPEDPQITQTKVIRAGGAPDRHINIIFVRAPSASNHQNTEVILPEAPQQKTLVYVLVKKQESSNNVRVRGPAPTRPSKPEVYFIRYKDGGPGGPANSPGGNAAPAYGPPPPAPVGVNHANAGY